MLSTTYMDIEHIIDWVFCYVYYSTLLKILDEKSYGVSIMITETETAKLLAQQSKVGVHVSSQLS